jgi:hypothetical protein
LAPIEAFAGIAVQPWDLVSWDYYAQPVTGKTWAGKHRLVMPACGVLGHVGELRLVELVVVAQVADLVERG